MKKGLIIGLAITGVFALFITIMISWFVGGLFGGGGSSSRL